MKSLLTILEISKIVGLEYSSMRTYLDGYRFAKFRDVPNIRRQVGYNCNKEFWAELISFLKIKKHYKYVDNIKQYLETQKNKRYNNCVNSESEE